MPEARHRPIPDHGVVIDARKMRLARIDADLLRGQLGAAVAYALRARGHNVTADELIGTVSEAEKTRERPFILGRPKAEAIALILDVPLEHLLADPEAGDAT